MMISTPENQIADPSPEEDVVLSVEGVSKKFCRSLKRSLFYGVQDIASELFGLRQQSDTLRTREFWALKDVSLKLRRGEALGLVGANGSGKTTLLRIISGLIRPDTGSVRIRGRVAPLIALGAGFNPILTGRENIFANMSVLGLSTKEIKARFDSVVEFAEIGDAIDSPVHSYSSGMAARLGFACAIHTNPEILLIDEVLAVGDIQFLAKCHRRLHELREQGIAFVLVSHNPQAILSMCQQSLYLQKGNVVAYSDTETIMNQYEEDLFLGAAQKVSGLLRMPDKPADESLGLDITSLCFKDTNNQILEELISGETVQLCIGFTSHKLLDDVNIRISIIKEGQTVLYLGGSNDKLTFHIPPGHHEVKVLLPNFGLSPGVYIMRVDIRNSALFILDIVETFRFVVRTNGRMSKCLFYQPRSWELVAYEKTAKEDVNASP